MALYLTRSLLVDDVDPSIQYTGGPWFQDTNATDSPGFFGRSLFSTLHGTNSSGGITFVFNGMSAESPHIMIIGSQSCNWNRNSDTSRRRLPQHDSRRGIPNLDMPCGWCHSKLQRFRQSKQPLDPVREHHPLRRAAHFNPANAGPRGAAILV